MKNLIVLGLFSIISFSQAGVLPASTTLIKQATSIAHPTAIAYTQPIAYSAPLAYSVAPTVYSQQYLPYYSSPLLSHGNLIAQYPGLIAQNPVLQYPVGGVVLGQQPTGQEQTPVQGASPAVEPVSNPQTPPQQPQSPILSGPSPGTTADDDTVSVEAA